MENDSATPGQRKKRFLLKACLVVLFGALIAGAIPVLFQNWLIYRPLRYPKFLTPQSEGYESFHPYETAGGAEQWGYLIEPGSRSARGTTGNGDGESTTATHAIAARPNFYLVFNGNATTALMNAGMYETLAQRTGCGFFIVDYRGFGFNAGGPDERGIVNDAIGAYDTLESEGRFDGGVGVIGQSLGGGAALVLTAERAVDRLILISTFTSMDAMVRRAVPWPLYVFNRSHFPNEQRLSDLTTRGAGQRPREIYLLHGRADELIPFSMGEALAEAGGPAVTFIPIDAATHFDMHVLALDEIARILLGDVPDG